MADRYLKSSLLYNSIIRHDFEGVKDLLLNGANPNIVTRDGASPMHIVVGLTDASTCERLTELLLNYGGDCNVRDPDGITPLAIACGFGRCDIVKTLLKHGGDPQIQNNDGEDCLDQAILSGCDGCVALIMYHLELHGNTSKDKVLVHDRDNRVNPKKLPRRSSVLSYTQKVQNLIDLEYEANYLSDRTFQLDVTSPDHPVLVKRCDSESVSPSGDAPSVEREVDVSVGSNSSSSSSASFHSVPSHEASPAPSPEETVKKTFTETFPYLTVASKPFPPLDRKINLYKEKTNRLETLLENVSVNTVSSLDLSLDPRDPRVLQDLTLSTDTSLNRAKLIGKLENLDITDKHDDSSLGDETLREMKELMLSDGSLLLQSDKTVDKSITVKSGETIERDKENMNTDTGERCTKQGDIVLCTGDNARFSKRYYVPLSESDLYTDDESVIGINRTAEKYIPSMDSGFGSSTKFVSGDTPVKQALQRNSSLPNKNRCFNDQLDPASDSIVAQSINNPKDFELNTTYLCRGVSPTSLPIHPDFFCSPRTSSRCIESSTSSENSCHSNMSVTPDACSPCSSESLEKLLLTNDKTASELSGICCLNSSGQSIMQSPRTMNSLNNKEKVNLIKDSEIHKCTQNFDSRTKNLTIDEDVFSSKTLPCPQYDTMCDHSKSTTFDCPSVNTPLSSLKYSNGELSSQHTRNPRGDAQSTCRTGLISLFNKEETVDGMKDDISTISTESKNSTCPCGDKRMNRVYSDSEGGISLVEVCLSKDDQNCTLHSDKLSEKFEDSTLVLDWRDWEAETSKASHGNMSCTPVNTQQTPVKQHISSLPASFHPRGDTDHDTSVLSTASSPQVCVSEVIKSLRDCDLRQALEALGDRPGPITLTTRKAYEIKLARLQSEPDTAKYRTEQDVFCPELRKALNGQFIMPACDDLEVSLTKMFEEPNPKKQYREGTKKTSFNYLLLDPRVTQNLPARAQNLTEEEGFEVFVKSIFYVGKGKRSRPYAHFKEAIRHITGKVTKDASKKVLQIVKIWEAGLGVVSMHVFQNIIPTEAYTREACLIEALGLKRLTNVQSGQFYENVASWSSKKKRQAGVILLKKAYKIFILEGERQIRAYDIKDIS